MNSNVSKNDILEQQTKARPIIIPNAIIGYFGDIIINIAKYKVKNHKAISQKDSR